MLPTLPRTILSLPSASISQQRGDPQGPVLRPPRRPEAAPAAGQQLCCGKGSRWLFFFCFFFNIQFLFWCLAVCWKGEHLRSYHQCFLSLVSRSSDFTADGGGGEPEAPPMQPPSLSPCFDASSRPLAAWAAPLPRDSQLNIHLCSPLGADAGPGRAGAERPLNPGLDGAALVVTGEAQLRPLRFPVQTRRVMTGRLEPQPLHMHFSRAKTPICTKNSVREVGFSRATRSVAAWEVL